MKKTLRAIILSILIGSSLIGCENSNEKTNTQTSEIRKDSLSENKTQTLCFRNDYPFKSDPKIKDVIELNLSIKNEKVKGTYNWLPAQKDQRKGHLTGKIKDNVIEAKYTFSQEGVKETTSITITLVDNKAVIKGGNAELGLDATINKIDCNSSETNEKKINKYAASFTDSLMVYKTEDLIIQKLSNHVYKHTSFLNTNDYGKVACNGMITVNKDEAVIFDAPTNNNSSKELINFVTHKLKRKIIAVIPTHFHKDCVGGLEAFMEHNIPTFASNKTIGFLNKEGKKYSKSLSGFDDSLTLNIGGQKVYAKYFGEGHTKDNIVGYFPEDNVVFGGCLIKEVGATKGNADDANVKDWPHTVHKVKLKYPNAKIVIPGHGKWGGTELFDYTIKLFE